MTKGANTRDRILAVAIEQAGECGLGGLTIERIAVAAGLTHPALYKYFRGIVDLRREVAKQAIAIDNSRVIARLILDSDPSVDAMSQRERRHHLANASSLR